MPKFRKQRVSTAAFAQAVNPVRAKPRTKWWEKFELIKEHVKRDMLFQNIPSELESWVHQTRASWRHGQLDTDQIMALREIHFPFNPRRSRENARIANQKRGEGLTALFALHESFVNGEKLSDSDMEAYQRQMNQYRAKYSSGQLSTTSARKLGITN